MGAFYLNHYHFWRFLIRSFKEIGEAAFNVKALCTRISDELSLRATVRLAFGVGRLSIRLHYRQLPVKAPEITVCAT
jgi:hypothetical protein